MSTSGNAAQSARYGERVTEIPDAIAPFLQHRSIRKFKSDPIPDAMMLGLIAAAQSASTSSNLQLWTAISVDEPARREQIAQLCGNQNQVRQAARFLAFFADHHRILEAAMAVGEPCAGADFEEFYIMAIIDAALAAERLVCAAESLGLGICYIGALRNDPPAVQALLNTPNQTVACLGSASAGQKNPTQHTSSQDYAPKPFGIRKPMAKPLRLRRNMTGACKPSTKVKACKATLRGPCGQASA